MQTQQWRLGEWAFCVCGSKCLSCSRGWAGGPNGPLEPAPSTSSRFLPNLPCAFPLQYSWASLVAQLVKNPPAMGHLASIPGLGRSPGDGKGYSPQYSGLENPMNCIVHGVTKSKTWLSDFHFTLLFLLGLPPHLPQTFAFFKVFTWNNRLVPNRKRRTSKLYIVTLLI